MSWIRVNRNKPCPICQRSDGCVVAADGSACLCSREPSERLIGQPFAGGWYHVLNPDLAQRVKNVFKRQPKKKPLPPLYWDDLMKEYMANCNSEVMTVACNELGFSVNTLQAMMFGYDIMRNAQVVPMWDGVGRIVGMRLRKGKEKWSFKGSMSGIFWPTTTIKTSNEPLMICEGWTDTGAAIELGFEPIGRPSCSGGTGYIKSFLKGSRRKVVIMADNDSPKKRIDGSLWRPGQEGAVRLAEAIAPLTASVKVVQPPVKDLRQWYNQGCTRKDVERLIK